MSTTIDQKVVEMRFDNKNFESNIKDTMSTLDKFKQKLNLTGASKGLENINTSANKINMSGMSNAIQSVTAKFSALEVMGVTALANITNSAVNAGKRIVKSLTIDPVSDGWKEYEMTLNAVQTTMAGTGKTAKEVETELKKLDEYADKTVYSTADMLNNLPKFTNAGVELEKATTAMIGIANATALAGGDANKASIAFYNLGQSIGTGYLTRMDYNSINNAGIATMEWKEQMVDAAIAAGTLKKVGDDTYKAGKKTFTIQQLFIDGLQEQWASADVLMKVFQDYGNETTEIGKKAYAAAQDIKTFSMMMDSLKATAGTGWKDTWQIIFGDLDKAKEFWTGLTNFISNIITSMADFRNNLLQGALGKSFTGLFDKIKESSNTVKEAVKPLKEYAVIVEEIIGGKWGNTQKRWDALAEAGYDWAHAQNLVNEKLGSSVRHATKYNEKQNDIVNSQKKVTASTNKQIAQLAKLSKAELKAMNFTDEQIQAFQDLAEAAEKTGIPLEKFIENIDEIDGRYLLINSFKNLGESLVSIFKSVGEAWTNAFPPMTSNQLFDIIAGLHKFSTIIRENVEKNADKLTRTLKGLFAIIDIIANFVGGGFKIAFTILKSVLKVFNLDILEFTARIGDAIVKVRDWIEEHNLLAKGIEFILPYMIKAVEAIKDWIANNELITKTINNFKTGLESLTKKYNDWVDSIGGKENIGKHLVEGLANGIVSGAKTIINAIVTLGKKLWEAFCDFFGIASPSKKFEEAGGYMVEGLINGIKDGASGFIQAIKDSFGSIDKINWSGMASMLSFAQMLIPGFQRSIGITSAFARWMNSIGIDSVSGLISGFLSGIPKVINAILNIGKAIFEAFCGFFDINSPSKVFMVLGGFIISGLILGLTNGSSDILSSINELGSNLVEGFKNVISKIDFGKLFAAGLGVGILFVAKSMLKTIDNVAGAVDKIASVPINLTAPLKGVGELLTGLGKSMKDFAKGYKAAKQGESIKNMAIAIALLAASVFVLSKIKPGTLWATIGAIAALAVIIGTLAFAMAKLNTLGGSIKSSLSGMTIASIATALLILAVTMKQLQKLDPDNMGTVITSLIIAVGALSLLFLAIGKMVKGNDLRNVHKVGKMITKISIALLLMVGVIKLASMLDDKEIIKGVGVIAALGLLIGGLIFISTIAGDNAAKAGKMISKISIALLIAIGVIKLASMLDDKEIIKGIGVIASLGILFAGLVAVSKFAGQHAAKAGWMILQMAMAFGIAVAVVKIASIIKDNELKRSLEVVTALGIVFAALIGVSHFAGKNAIKAGAMILEISVALLILTGVLLILSKIDNDGLYRALGIVTVLEILFGGLIFVSKFAGDCVKTIITISIVIALLVGALIGLSFMDPTKLMNTAASLSMILIALGVAMACLKPLTGDFKGVAKSVGALALMGLVVGEIGLILGLLNKYDLHASLNDVAALSGMLIVMTGVLAALSIIGLMAPTSFAGIGALAVLGLVVGEIGLILGLLNKYDLHASMEDVKAISTMLLVMSGALAILGVVGLMGPAAFIGIGALETLIIALGGTLVALGALQEHVFDIEGFIDKGLPILEKIGKGLGLFVGGLVGGLAEGITSSLPGIAQDLTNFMNILNEGFIPGAKSIDQDTINGVKNIADAIWTLTKADFLNTSLFGGSSIIDFGKDLSKFGGYLQEYSDSVKDVDSDKILASSTAAKNLAEAAEAASHDGLFGTDGIDDFGKNLVTFGNKLKEYSNTVKELDSESINNSIEPAKSVFALGKEVAEIKDGWLGTDGIDDFGKNIATFGVKLKAYGDSVKDLDSESVEKSIDPAKALFALGKEVAEIKDGWLGTDGIDDYGSNIATFGLYLKEYSGYVSDLDTDAVSKSIQPAKDLITLGKEVSGIDDGTFGKDGIDNFGKDMKKFGEKLAGYAKKVKELDTTSIDNSVIAAKKIIEMIKSTSGIDTTNVDTFSTALSKLGEVNVDKFISAFNDSTSKITSVGTNFINTLIEVIASKNGLFQEAGNNSFLNYLKGILTNYQTRIQTTVSTIISTAINGINNNYKSFYNAGGYLCQGLTNGLKDPVKRQAVYNAAYSLGKLAVQGEKDGQDSHSPSKATEQAGKWLGEGLIIGIKNISGKVYSTGRSLGEETTNTISNALNTAMNLLDADMDSQPTIRPILDLSNVESGVGMLNGMFNNGPSLAVATNLGAISSGMNARIQNGNNNDVISAINRLGKNLGNVKGDTYNIDGITYDDGSNITDAVKTLVRAAKVGRRT